MGGLLLHTQKMLLAPEKGAPPSKEALCIDITHYVCLASPDAMLLVAVAADDDDDEDDDDLGWCC